VTLLGIVVVAVVIVPAPPGGIAGAGGVCACAKFPPLLSIPNVRSSVEKIATLYRILLQYI
jgi:hypothetical protein